MRDASTRIRREKSYPRDFLRLLRLGGKAERKEHSAKRQGCNFYLHVFLCLDPLVTLHPTLATRPFLLDHLIRPCEKLWRKCQPDLFCCLKINDELKLRCLLYGQISRFGTFQDLVHVNRRTPIKVNVVRAVGHETALVDELPLKVNRRQAVFAGQLHEPLSCGEK